MLSSTSHSSSPPDADRLIGQLLDSRLRVLRCIGRGGMGTVYVAEHIGLGKQVAVKVLNPTYAGQADVMARLHSEARNASAIASEHIVDVFDIGLAESGQPYVVMELLHGESLAERLRRCTALSELDTLHIGRQLASALAAAHRSGIVHRDIKPENIFLCHRDGRDFVKLLDFGISKAVGPLSDLEPDAREDSPGPAGGAGGDQAPATQGGLSTADADSTAPRPDPSATDRHASPRDRSTPSAELLHRLTRTGAILGTPLYMSPEQARGERLDSRCDIYSLGVVLYECLTGSVPFLSTSYFGVIAKILTERPEPPSVRMPDRALSVALEQIVLCAMAADRGERYQTMDALLADLDRYQRGEPIHGWNSTRVSGRATPRGEATEPADGWRRLLLALGGSRRERGPLPMLLPLLAGTLVVLLLGGLLVFWRGPQTRPGGPPGHVESRMAASATTSAVDSQAGASQPGHAATRSAEPRDPAQRGPSPSDLTSTSIAAATRASGQGGAGASSAASSSSAATPDGTPGRLPSPTQAPAPVAATDAVGATARRAAPSSTGSSGQAASPSAVRPPAPRSRPSPHRPPATRPAAPGGLPTAPLPAPLGDEQAPNPFVPHAPST